MPVKNLVGKKFGRWTVLEQAASRNGASYWNCRCDCGIEKEVKGQSLTSGKSQSCGCYKKDFWTRDISNQRFGRLVVISNTGKTSLDHYAIWQCKCDCGNICEVDSHSLQEGNTQSCGCLRKERAAIATSEKCRIDLLGKVFGQLTVISDMGSIEGKTYWKCKCACGNEIITRTEYLQSGHKNSCGCLKESVGELNIRLLLEQTNIKYKQEYNPGFNRFFDFAIIDNDGTVTRLIEFDGIQHYEQIDFFSSRTLEEQQRIDKVKNEYALSHNIPLVRIPYWERDKITLEMIMGDQYLITEA